MLVIFVKLKAWLNNSVWAIAFNLAFWSVKGLKFKCHTSAKFWYISWFKIAHLDFSADQWSICLLALAFSREIHFFSMCTHVQILGSGCFAGSFVASFFLCFSFKIRVKMGRLRWIMDRLEVMEIAQPWHNVLLSERSLHGLLHGLLDWVWVNRDHSLFHSSIKV